MPTPIYIICCESGTEDKYTGMASLFNIIDRIVVKPRDPEKTDSGAPNPWGSLSMRIVAVWAANGDGDFDGEFDGELRMLMSPQNQEQILMTDKVRFTRAMPRHRSTVIISGFQAEQVGQVIVESTIKRAGESEHLTQRYAIDVLVSPPDVAVSAPNEEGGVAQGPG